MAGRIEGLGWFVRRSAQPERLAAFYETVVGLPLLRRPNEKISVFWAGEATVFQILEGGTPQPAYTDRDQAPCVPIFRVHGMDAIIDRLKAAGVRFISDVLQPNGRAAYFLDPDNNVTGLQERFRSSPRDEDQEAFRRWDNGEVTIEGAGPMPEGFQHLSWVVLRVEDVEAQAAWYHKTFGFEIVLSNGANSAHLDMGDCGILALLPGGTKRTPPSSRTELSNAWLLRVTQFDNWVGQFWTVGAPFIEGVIPTPGGLMTYVLDPEGNAVGIQQNPKDDVSIEEIEATRRRPAWDLPDVDYEPHHDHKH